MVFLFLTPFPDETQRNVSETSSESLDELENVFRETNEKNEN